MTGVGNYIYSGFIPLVKMGFTILAGFVLAKRGLFPPEASRGASHLSMTIGLPCLIFASVVPAFNSDNIRFLGPLCLSALVYQASGLALGFIIRECFYVPVDFRYGILIATTFSK
jgi:predicted permease